MPTFLSAEGERNRAAVLDALPARMLDEMVLTVRQAAAVLGVSDDLLRRMELAGKGPPRVQLSPGRFGYRWSDVRTYSLNKETR